MGVFVLDKNRQPLMPCQPARARKLLREGKAAVFRCYPFTIILKERAGGTTQPISLTVDPGSKTTGISLNAQFNSGTVCIFAMQLEHRGRQIKESLDSRRGVRRSRRNRNTRYRQPRFLNRSRPKGWLPPSLLSRVDNTETWAERLVRLAPICSANVEIARFDLQLLENPDITGIEYQQGTLYGFELREYLLARHQHTCAYCHGLSKDSILEIEHILPKSLGGTDRVGNLVVACRTCNQHKNNLHPQAWADACRKRKNKLEQQRSLAMRAILKGHRPTLKDAAAVNATRYAVGRVIKQLIPDIRFCSGGQTKRNRTLQGYPKAHWIDAACVGEQGQQVRLECSGYLQVSAKGHGARQQCRMDKYGFPRTSAKAARTVQGFRTGDIVEARVPTGKKAGHYIGRVAVRSSGFFNITSQRIVTQGISYQYCRTLHRCDGYGYGYVIDTQIASTQQEDAGEAA
ncbi:HNH endonuclease [Nitrosococcus halophilus Nc 4]|uniref:HNH endonuclease n=1 Tax=Nitrosococcus halophilus (strain Nc4) TaxID=472759 RepID=D5BVE2_NITHN|nr:RNA-guided endonuclease IscB [Nitrosococcus halophilus]ADE13570.1 HNH endonuclease [Nitrosococcus halophilus Nc 4]